MGRQRAVLQAVREVVLTSSMEPVLLRPVPFACLVEGCDKPMCAGGLCAGQRFQMRKHVRIVSVDLREPRGDQWRRSAPSEPLTLTCQGCAKEFRVPSGIAVAKEGKITRKFCTKACMVAKLIRS